MQFLESLRTLAALGFMSVVGTASAFGDGSSQIDIRASIAAHCDIGELQALETSTGSAVRVSTICNTTSYTLEFSGVSDLRLASASGVQNIGDGLALGSSSIRVEPRLPGAQIVDIAFENSLEELASLTVNLGTY